MSLITEDIKHSVNTLEEVRKLQELVKKLEIQNLHLRNKQHRSSVSPVKELKSRKLSDSKAEGNDENPNNAKDEFDDLDIIKLSDIEMSDDESWLYKSPKSSKEDHDESYYEWLRKDVDDLENKQLQLAKNALLSKVTELGIVGYEPKKHVDTRTFTRSKKKQTIEFLSRLDKLNNEKVEKNCFSRPRRGSDVSSDSLSSCHILEDASDVEEVARMQEESLRNSSPLGTPKRGTYGCSALSRKISLSSRCSISDQDLSECSLLGVPDSEDPGNESVENSSFVVEPTHHSDQSSSSDSPYNSNMSLHSNDKIQGKLSGYRRSLPNLNREPLAVRQSKSSSTSDKVKLQNQRLTGRVTDTYVQSSEKPRKEYTSPLRRPLNQRTSPNNEAVTSVPKSAESSHIRARSGLPRPSRASSASRSAARSGIPMPSMLSKKQEDSWSEGCF